jgi:hypothetical protein
VAFEITSTRATTNLLLGAWKLDSCSSTHCCCLIALTPLYFLVRLLSCLGQPQLLKAPLFSPTPFISHLPSSPSHSHQPNPPQPKASATDSTRPDQTSQTTNPTLTRPTPPPDSPPHSLALARHPLPANVPPTSTLPLPPSRRPFRTRTRTRHRTQGLPSDICDARRPRMSGGGRRRSGSGAGHEGGEGGGGG